MHIPHTEVSGRRHFAAGRLRPASSAAPVRHNLRQVSAVVEGRSSRISMPGSSPEAPGSRPSIFLAATGRMKATAGAELTEPQQPEGQALVPWATIWRGQVVLLVQIAQTGATGE